MRQGYLRVSMRAALLLASVVFLGCAKPSTPAPGSLTVPDEPSAQARNADLREDDVQAAYGLDTACASVEEARGKAKVLAALAGGEAGQALNDVTEALDAAGQALADHTDPPPAERAFTEAERKEAAQSAADALGELRDAGDILDGLAQNAPKAHQAVLEAIRSAVGEAEDAIEGAMEDLGAKAPPEEEAPEPSGH